MVARVCTGCTTVYAVGAPCCPHCASVDSVEQGEPMPKNTVHGGPSNAHAEPTNAGAAESTPAEAAPAPELQGEQPSPGNSSEHAVEPNYESWTVEQLKKQLSERNLSKTGKRDDLVLRLVEDDASRAADTEDATPAQDTE